MDCERYRYAISARLDGEEPGVEPPLLQHHLSTCSACRNWEHDAVGLARAVRVSSAEPIPDLTPSILVAIGREPAPVRRAIPLLRVALGIVGLVKLMVPGHALFFHEPGLHVTRGLSSFELALAVGFLCAAWRPVRAYGLLPPVSTVMALLLVIPLLDGSIAYSSMFTESTHILQVVGFGLVFVLARTVPQTPIGRPRNQHRRLLHGA
jgi:predicted anti-sigma-YlaC factor YlaD